MESLLEHHIACGLLVREGRVLLVHRSPTKRWYPDVWDFPGGHLEPGESSSQALMRELQEELNIEIVPPTGSALHSIQTGTALIEIWKVDEWFGAVVNAAPNEHDRFGWFTADEITALDLADAVYQAVIDRVLT